MKLEVSQPPVLHPRLRAFRDRFGEAHLHLAYHAAFPLALTPDLLYRLWANFQQDIQGEMLDIPWVAVADLLLSSLCEEVGHELYEMDRDVRAALLDQLKHDARFGQTRLRELSDFLLTYVQQQLNSPDIDIRDRAKTQQWAAIAYTQPHEVAQELSHALTTTYQNNKTECLRIAAIVETLADPLAEFEPLLIDAREKASAVRSGTVMPVRERLYWVYWAIGVTTAIVLAGLVYRYVSTLKPEPIASPTLSPLLSPTPAQASSSPSPKPTVTTPAAASRSPVAAPVEVPSKPVPTDSSPKQSFPVVDPAVSTPTKTHTPVATPPNSSPNTPVSPSSEATNDPSSQSPVTVDPPCLTFKCPESRGAATR